MHREGVKELGQKLKVQALPVDKHAEIRGWGSSGQEFRVQDEPVDNNKSNVFFYVPFSV